MAAVFDEEEDPLPDLDELFPGWEATEVAEEGADPALEAEATAVVVCPVPEPINEPGITSGESGDKTQDKKVVGYKVSDSCLLTTSTESGGGIPEALGLQEKK